MYEPWIHFNNSMHSPTLHQHYPIAKHHVPSNVVAVFIARFDRTSGNTIEWQHPEGMFYVFYLTTSVLTCI